MELSHLKCKYFSIAAMAVTLHIVYQQIGNQSPPHVLFSVHVAQWRLNGFSFLLFVSRLFHAVCVCRNLCLFYDFVKKCKLYFNMKPKKDTKVAQHLSSQIVTCLPISCSLAIQQWRLCSVEGLETVSHKVSTHFIVSLLCIRLILCTTVSI